MLKKLMTTLVVGASISTANAAVLTTQDASGNLDLKVNLPQTLVLYHWSNAGIEFFPANPVAYASGKGAGLGQLTETSIDVSDQDALGGSGSSSLSTIQTPNGQADNKISVTLKNAWAVRSLTENGTVNLAITNPDPEHKKDGSVVSTTNVKVTSAGKNAGNSVQLESKWAPTQGDITFDLDLSKATKAGLHESDGDTFTLTLTGTQ